ncbi:unnamed protein product [Pleuronectes platessa]|uniref:Uncharacterized protein n=1 Tax=Pleuronectes platessa TaxID=8262 RepID=A0A9N7YLW0_PLEPL|nr:unnamed protein product [Pleuronectes platessa]
MPLEEVSFEGGQRVSFLDGLWERDPETRGYLLKALDPMVDSRAGGVVRSMEEEKWRMRMGVMLCRMSERAPVCVANLPILQRDAAPDDDQLLNTRRAGWLPCLKLMMVVWGGGSNSTSTSTRGSISTGHFGMQMGQIGERTANLQVGGRPLYPSATAANTRETRTETVTERH